MLPRQFAPALVLILTWIDVSGADEKDNPFRTAKVGDFNSYKMTTKVGDLAIEGTLKVIVSEKDENTAKVKSEIKVMGTSLGVQESTIDLRKPLAIASVIHQAQIGGTFTKTSAGTAKIKVAAKEYDAVWVAGKVASETKGIKIETEIKIWLSKDVPLNGMLRMETKGNVVIELAK